MIKTYIKNILKLQKNKNINLKTFSTFTSMNQ